MLCFQRVKGILLVAFGNVEKEFETPMPGGLVVCNTSGFVESVLICLIGKIGKTECCYMNV